MRSRLPTGAVVALGALGASALGIAGNLATTGRNSLPLWLQPYQRWAWWIVLILLLAVPALNLWQAARQRLPTTPPDSPTTDDAIQSGTAAGPDLTIIVMRAVVMTTIALLLAVAVGVLAALVISSGPTKADVPSLEALVADFRPFGFGPVKKKRLFDLASLPSYYDERQKALLRDLGLRRALAMSFPHSASNYNLEVRIFEFRGAAQALKGQHELSICFGLPHTSFDTPGVTGSKGTHCVAPLVGPIQEVTFTKAGRLYKLKLTKGGAPLPTSTKMITDLSRREETVAW